MDAPLLIVAEEKAKDVVDRVPAWVRRADWSSNDTLLAFWSAHPPEMRNEFLNNRAESYVKNFREQLGKHRTEMSSLWQARKQLIESEAGAIAKLPADSFADLRRREIREEHETRLLSLRASMKVERSRVRRCIRYLRAIRPKQIRSIHKAGAA